MGTDKRVVPQNATPIKMKDGRVFASVSAFAQEYGLKYVSVKYHLNKGRTPEQLIARLGSLPTATRYKKDSVAACACAYNGVSYPSISAAAEALGISSQQVYALKNHEGFSADEALTRVMELNKALGTKAIPLEHQRIRPCIVDGVPYRTQGEALKAYGMQYITIKSRMDREGISFEEALKRGTKERRGVVSVSSHWWNCELTEASPPSDPKSSMGQLYSMLEQCTYHPTCYTDKKKTLGIISFEEGLRAIGPKSVVYLLFPYEPVGYTMDLEMVIPELMPLPESAADGGSSLLQAINETGILYLGAKAGVANHHIFANWFMQTPWSHINIRLTLSSICKFIGTAAAVEDHLTQYLQTLKEPELA